jgi:hypothetical protein
VRFEKDEAKAEILTWHSETNSKNKIRKPLNGVREPVFVIAPSDFRFVSDFGFRASDLDHTGFGLLSALDLRVSDLTASN